jgi:hypothetical protein
VSKTTVAVPVAGLGLGGVSFAPSMVVVNVIVAAVAAGACENVSTVAQTVVRNRLFRMWG